MPARTYDLHGVRVLEFGTDGPPLRQPRDAADLIGEAMAQSAELVVLPTPLLDPSFFQLRSGLAGEVLQKFVNHRIRLVIVGDISAALAASSALRDFVHESNRGRAVWFLADLDELERRLAPAGG